jgi:hypothetical protein
MSPGDRGLLRISLRIQPARGSQPLLLWPGPALRRRRPRSPPSSCAGFGLARLSAGGAVADPALCGTTTRISWPGRARIVTGRGLYDGWSTDPKPNGSEPAESVRGRGLARLSVAGRGLARLSPGAPGGSSGPRGTTTRISWPGSAITVRGVATPGAGLAELREDRKPKGSRPGIIRPWLGVSVSRLSLL